MKKQKIYPSVDALNKLLKEQSDKKIVFTNGVFDILHPGHIELLEYAKKCGDLLIVGINDDLSVSRLKGENRPVFALNERMEILAAVSSVDYIVPFSEDTPYELITGLSRIDVLVKGGDYLPENVVGKNEVERAGGQLLLFKFKSDISSTRIIEKIKEKGLISL